MKLGHNHQCVNSGGRGEETVCAGGQWDSVLGSLTIERAVYGATLVRWTRTAQSEIFLTISWQAKARRERGAETLRERESAKETK